MFFVVYSNIILSPLIFATPSSLTILVPSSNTRMTL
jgi:hypothetical protein